MLTTGNQLRASRALAGNVSQAELATAAGVNINTIRDMEARGDKTLSSRLSTIVKIQEVLEKAGVEFLNHGNPGVRLK